MNVDELSYVTEVPHTAPHLTDPHGDGDPTQTSMLMEYRMSVNELDVVYPQSHRPERLRQSRIIAGWCDGSTCDHLAKSVRPEKDRVALWPVKLPTDALSGCAKAAST